MSILAQDLHVRVSEMKVMNGSGIAYAKAVPASGGMQELCQNRGLGVPNPDWIPIPQIN